MAGTEPFEWLDPWEEEGPPDGVLEGELARELREEDPLYGIPVQLIGRRGDRDDYLFQLLDGSGRVAVVHLTFRGRTELPGWPRSWIYSSLTAWAEQRMRPEHAEWEE